MPPLRSYRSTPRRPLVALLIAGLLAVAAPSVERAHAQTASYARAGVHPRFGGAIDSARAIAMELMAERRIPGLSVAVAVDGEMIWSEGFGFADGENRVPVTPLTRFRIASISKPVTAAAIGLLVEQGRLDLDAPVQRYVPRFPQKSSDGRETGYGIGWSVGRDSTGRRTIGHSGGAVGDNTYLLLLPDQRIVVALLANTSNAGTNARVAGRIARQFISAAYR